MTAGGNLARPTRYGRIWEAIDERLGLSGLAYPVPAHALTASLAVTAAAGAAASEPADPARETILPRDRSPLELVIIIGAIAVIVIAGAVLVLRAERLGGRRTPEPP